MDSTLFGLSVFFVPAGIFVLTVASLMFWEPEYPAGHPQPVEFRVFEEAGQTLEPADALQRLEGLTAVPYKETSRSESPFWLLFQAQPIKAGQAFDIELPSRHAMRLACWNAAGFAPLGTGNRMSTEGLVLRAKAGYALEFADDAKAARVICRVSHSGPARITVQRWTKSDLESSMQQYHRKSGLLEGGLILMSMFVLATAVINREWTYVIFAAWLVTSMRLAAISTGWDTQWLEHWVPDDWLFPVRKLTAAAYYILTFTLFSRLFRNELKVVGYAPLLRVAQWACGPLLVAAVLLPFAVWLPILWVTSSYAVLVAMFLLGRIVIRTRSPVAMWYGASLGVTLFASFSEVIAAALGIRELIGQVNFVTASLSSSLLAALAIGHQMRLERMARLNAEAELKHAYDAIPIGLFTLDENGAFLRVNPTMTAMLGVDLAAGPSRWQDYFDRNAWPMLQAVVCNSQRAEVEVRGTTPGDSTPRWYLVKATLASRKIEGSLQDVTERVTATERLRFLAEHDPLTNVLNRRGIELILEQAIRDLEEGGSLALAYLDLDRFKLINEMFGHAAGDVILKQVCTRISGMLSPGQHLGRVGGDEFVIVMPGAPLSSVRWVCRGIVDRIQREHYLAGESAFQVRGSVGLIEVVPGTSVKDAIAVADRACREAKRGRHEGLVVYEKSEELFREREAELRLIAHLDKGRAPDGLFLEMQPIMSLKAPFDSLDFEVLLRMRDDEGAVLTGGPIVAAAENNGRIGVIDRWVLTTTLQWIETHFARLGKTRFICMNLSGASLNDERFIRDAFAIIGQHREAATRLCIEITEGVALHDLENTRRFIERVREHGARIALDDFGAGYTSFSYLKELPAEVVKIDGMFVRGVNVHPANLAIVEAIVALANNLGMRTIAEWAEDAATVEALALVGVDYVQGYAVSRPLDPDRILAADSAAGFVADARLADFLHTRKAPGLALEFWDEPLAVDPKDLH